MNRNKWTRTIAIVCVGLLAGVIYWFLHPKADGLGFAVLGGVFASVTFEFVLLLIDWADHWLNKRSLLNAFGSDIFDGDFTLAYASFRASPQAQNALTTAGMSFPHIATDDDQHNPARLFRVDEAVAAHDLRALTYLATHLIKNGAKLQIRRAADIVQPFDLSFVAFGLGGSQKARQLLEQLNLFGIQVANTPGGWLDLQRSSSPLAQPTNGRVVGYVIRLHPKQFADRTWFLCAGPGPDGTIAAGFYLARHFDRINRLIAADGKRLGKRPCVVIVRSTPGLEASAIADAPIPLQ